MNEIMIIDSHAHLYLPEFEQDRKEVSDRARQAGVEMILLPAIDSSTHEAMISLEKEDGLYRSMMGLHPCSVNQDYEKELKKVEEYASQRRFAAIGEIGLDFYWDKTFTAQQYEAFHFQVKLAMQMDLPIAVHSRNATAECIEVIEQYPGLRGVFHCFSGSLEEAQKLVGLGFYLGIGGVVTFKNSGLDKVVKALGVDSLLLETDAPYLAPVPFRGKRNEPSYLKYILEKVSTFTGIPGAEIAEITRQNTISLFRLNNLEK